LTARKRDFRGCHTSLSASDIETEAESMLSQAHRDDKEIRSGAAQKHASLIGQRGLIAAWRH